MKHLFVINPAAGKGSRAETLPQEIHRVCDRYGLKKDTDYEIWYSRKPGDITRYVRQSAKTGHALRIYACGGDGTLNEAVCGAAGFPNVALTHVPCGSGNDFIRMFTDAAPFSNLEALLDDPAETALDLIQCGSDYAINVCSMGFDARIGTEVANYKKLPLVKGHGAYLLSSLVNTIKGVSRPYRVELDGEVIEGDMTMICVGNGAWYGGGFHPIPEVDPTDGLLDVLLVKGVSRATVLKVIKPYKEGKYRDYPQYIEYRRTKRVKIISPAAEPVNLDGELRVAAQAEFSIAPYKLRFFYPRSTSLALFVEAPRQPALSRG